MLGWMLNTVMPDIRCQIPDTGYQMPDAGGWKHASIFILRSAKWDMPIFHRESSIELQVSGFNSNQLPKTKS